MRRKRSLSTVKRDEELLLWILPIKTDHPLWGYRRIWAYLKYREHHPLSLVFLLYPRFYMGMRKGKYRRCIPGGSSQPAYKPGDSQGQDLPTF